MNKGYGALSMLVMIAVIAVIIVLSLRALESPKSSDGVGGSTEAETTFAPLDKADSAAELLNKRTEDFEKEF